MIEMLKNPDVSIDSRTLKVLKDPYFHNASPRLFRSVVDRHDNAIQVVEINDVPVIATGKRTLIKEINIPVDFVGYDKSLSSLILRGGCHFSYASGTTTSSTYWDRWRFEEPHRRCRFVLASTDRHVISSICTHLNNQRITEIPKFNIVWRVLG